MEEPLRGGLRGASRRAVMRVVGSRFAKPIARIALAAACLCVLAVVGRTTVAGAVGASTVGASTVGDPPRDVAGRHDAPDPPAGVAGATGATAATAAARSGDGLLPDPARPSSRAPHAAPDDPVILNAATETDLRRLPGIGAKRADAIVSLRARLGRFHAVEDLLKVRGIGRATLKRLRPLIRLDPPAVDAGPPRPAATAPSPPPLP